MKTLSFIIRLNLITRFALCFIWGISIVSCEEFITVAPPTNQLITATVFEDELTAKAALLGIYAKMGLSGGPVAGSIGGISNLSALSADELKIVKPSELLSQFYNNSILSTNSYTTGIWNPYYEYIFYCNSLIEGLNKSTKLSTPLKQQLKGEALFIRAFCHFYLVNLYGRIPYISSTDYESNTNAKKREVAETYNLIVDDLRLAKDLLPLDYVFSEEKRTRVNSFAASALLARVYLLMKNNAESEAEASRVIDNPLFSLEDIDNVFLITSRESIWQLGNRDNLKYTNDGALFAGTTSKFDQSLTDDLIASFEVSDLRRSNWVQDLMLNGNPVYAPHKYKDNTTASVLNEKYAVLRLAEQFLIRAEARARQGNIVGLNSAASDLNIIRDRAGLGPLPTMDQDETLDAILLERNHELFTEMGTRWIDLKRLDLADEVLSQLKTDWEITDVLYPIPFQETLVNKNLIQNDGYN
jgi:starch-binding outer membrane protein, SusD/RagB family